VKPCSESCERNREPILAVLRKVFSYRRHVLEIGSGTGQHAVYFAQALPHLLWQTSDLEENHPGILEWVQEARLTNVLPPLCLDVNENDWPVVSVDAVFSANTLHILGWSEVRRFFDGVGRVLEPDGVLVVYGPFNYNGQYTSESNARFDQWLKERDPRSAIRDFEAVDELAQGAGLKLDSDHAMPANNRCLVWRRTAPKIGTASAV
jgi:cyclopropane fatty-acyl-phospholipid synthase-like methyltransferase